MSKQFDHSGSSFDDFLQEEGLLQDAEAVAIKRVLAWQIKDAMKSQGISKQSMAKQLNTSRSQIDRLLDPEYVGIALDTVARAAHAVGKQVRVQLVDAEANRTRAKPPKSKVRRSGRRDRAALAG